MRRYNDGITNRERSFTPLPLCQNDNLSYSGMYVCMYKYKESLPSKRQVRESMKGQVMFEMVSVACYSGGLTNP